MWWVTSSQTSGHRPHQIPPLWLCSSVVLQPSLSLSETLVVDLLHTDRDICRCILSFSDTALWLVKISMNQMLDFLTYSTVVALMTKREFYLCVKVSESQSSLKHLYLQLYWCWLTLMLFSPAFLAVWVITSLPSSNLARQLTSLPSTDTSSNFSSSLNLVSMVLRVVAVLMDQVPASSVMVTVGVETVAAFLSAQPKLRT